MLPRGALDLAPEVRIPPHVVRVDGDAEARSQLVAEIVGVLHRVHAGALGGVHRVQRLDRERHARAARVVEELADAVAHHFARAGEILRFDRAGAILRQPADDEDQASRAERERLVDRAPVVVLRRAPAFAVRRPGTSRRGNSR